MYIGSPATLSRRLSWPRVAALPLCPACVALLTEPSQQGGTGYPAHIGTWNLEPFQQVPAFSSPPFLSLSLPVLLSIFRADL